MILLGQSGHSSSLREIHRCCLTWSLTHLLANVSVLKCSCRYTEVNLNDPHLLCRLTQNQLMFDSCPLAFLRQCLRALINLWRLQNLISKLSLRLLHFSSRLISRDSSPRQPLSFLLLLEWLIHFLSHLLSHHHHHITLITNWSLDSFWGFHLRMLLLLLISSETCYHLSAVRATMEAASACESWSHT